MGKKSRRQRAKHSHEGPSSHTKANEGQRGPNEGSPADLQTTATEATMPGLGTEHIFMQHTEGKPRTVVPLPDGEIETRRKNTDANAARHVQQRIKEDESRMTQIDVERMLADVEEEEANAVEMKWTMPEKPASKYRGSMIVSTPTSFTFQLAVVPGNVNEISGMESGDLDACIKNLAERIGMRQSDLKGKLDKANKNEKNRVKNLRDLAKELFGEFDQQRKAR